MTMGQDTKIEWAHHTFNPWTGCTKVSPACDHCYAEGWSKRAGDRVGKWGPGAPRVRTTSSNWKQPLRWNAEAERLGVRYRVFCASLADVFDNEVPAEWRAELLRLIDETPNLDWLLLTKRIGNANAMLDVAEAIVCQSEWTNYYPRRNVWIGASITSQAEADRDIQKLLAVPAAKRFLSMEPLLGPVSFEGVFATDTVNDGTNALEALDWVIVGGESGPNARPMHPDWARSLRNQCQAAGVPFLFKQWGEWAPDPDLSAAGVKDWHPAACMVRIGKKAAGRLLEGREWNEVP